MLMLYICFVPNRCWFADGKDVLFDCDSKNSSSILEQLSKTLGKSKQLLELEENLRQSAGKGKTENPAIFGFNQKRFCMCEIPDQVPCPGLVDLPMAMQGKYKYLLKDKLEEWEADLEAPHPLDDQIAMGKKKRWLPEKHPPPVTEIPGLEVAYIRKPKQITLNCQDPDVLVKEHEVQSKLDRYFEKKGKKIKYVSKNVTS